MTANRLSSNALLNVLLCRLLPLLALTLACSAVLAQSDPPARAGSLSYLEGSVVLAPAGDTEWSDAVLNRPVTRGDRLWTDPGARAELHLGSAVLHMDQQTFVDITALDAYVLQASVNEGSVNARVRRLDVGENFEIDTPNLAFRAAQPGDYRIDVDPDRGATRVAVRSGLALVYGANGQSQQVYPGQQLAFGGRDLERVALPPLRHEEFDQWAAERNRREDQAIAARYVPRDVVGYHQLDPYGNWVQDATYGPVWFPHITIADWAPYRYGHWEWIRPWGWTWIDDAPWGFAPFHYGRWAMIGSRWCWVPGRLGPRPVYAPALVAFVGGGSGTSWSLTIGSGPGIAWYPLAPGEAWRPYFSASAVYVRNVNRYLGSADSHRIHIHQRRPDAVTAIGLHDFSRGRPVHRHWARVNPADLARAPLAVPPALPEPRRAPPTGRAVPPRAQPPVHSPPPAIVGQPPWRGPGVEQRSPADAGRPGFGSRDEGRQPPRRRLDEQRRFEPPRGQPHVRQEERMEERRERFQERQEERRAREEQRRPQSQQLQMEQQERARRDQQMHLERVQREQQMQVQRQMQEQRRAEQATMQREHAQRQQQAAQERIQRQQEMQQRAEQAAMQREHAQRQQQAAQERMQRQQQQMQQRAEQAAVQREHALRQQQAAQERVQRQQEMQQRAQQQLSGPPRAESRDAGEERRRHAQERHEQRRPPHGEEGRGRGQGQGRGG